MTNQHNNIAKARAEAAFDLPAADDRGYPPDELVPLGP